MFRRFLSGWTRTVAIGSEWPLGSPAKPWPVSNAQPKELESLPNASLTVESKSGLSSPVGIDLEDSR